MREIYVLSTVHYWTGLLHTRGKSQRPGIWNAVVNFGSVWERTRPPYVEGNILGICWLSRFITIYKNLFRMWKPFFFISRINNRHLNKCLNLKYKYLKVKNVNLLFLVLAGKYKLLCGSVKLRVHSLFS